MTDSRLPKRGGDDMRPGVTPRITRHLTGPEHPSLAKMGGNSKPCPNVGSIVRSRFIGVGRFLSHLRLRLRDNYPGGLHPGSVPKCNGHPLSAKDGGARRAFRS